MELTAPSLREALVSGSPKRALTMSYQFVSAARRACKRRTHLAIVKGTGDGKVVHIGISARRHLKLLNRADTTLGMQNSN